MKKSMLLLLTLILCGFLPLSGKNTGTQQEINLKMPPAVFAVENAYQILVTVKSQSLVRIKVGKKFYSDHINGVRPSGRSVHRFIVPMAELEKEGKYEVFTRKLPKRLPYMNKLTPLPEVSRTFPFRKLPSSGPIRIYHIADTHTLTDEPLQTVRAAGKFDLLILNGDIVDTMYKKEALEHPCLLAGKMTGGSIPVIYARGNHELRGAYAEQLHHYTPHHQGRSYYQIHLGPIHAFVLDAGEDKADSHPVYAHAIDCNTFRLEQLEYIRNCAVQNSKVPPAKYRFVISHVPFPRYAGKTPQDEKNRRFMVYGQWSQALKETFKPQLLISGHVHRNRIESKKEFPCTILMGTDRRMNKKGIYTLSGTRITLSGNTAKVEFTLPDGKVKESATLSLPR